LPKRSLFQLSYVGSQSHDLLLEGTLQKVDALPIGSLFDPDRITHTFIYPNSLSIAEQGDYWTYRPYLAVDVPRHLAYSYYNALQTSVSRTVGSLFYGFNYTWSKKLGIRSASGQPGDPIYPRNNYGPLSSDRSQIINVVYWFDLGNHDLAQHKSLDLVANGWMISGITAF